MLPRKGKVAVGAPGVETPTGLFFVRSQFTPSAEILGAFAFETSAYSTSGPAGGGIVGVHGTPWPRPSVGPSPTDAFACTRRRPLAARTDPRRDADHIVRACVVTGD